MQGGFSQLPDALDESPHCFENIKHLQVLSSQMFIEMI
jgi:hypothetical protein